MARESKAVKELKRKMWMAMNRYQSAEGCGCCEDYESRKAAAMEIAALVGADVEYGTISECPADGVGDE